MEIGGRVIGAADAIRALGLMGAAVDEANVRIVRRSQAKLENAAKKQFVGAHKRGEPTTSAPGSPPDVVTGTLRRSIQSDRATLTNSGVRGRVFPTAIYGRIQELGGGFLPPRPYMAPAYEQEKDNLRDIAIAEWTVATRG